MGEYQNIPGELRAGRATATPDAFINASELQLKIYCKKFEVAGEENIRTIREMRNSDPDNKFVIASSHFSDQDVQSAVKVLGRDLNIQVTGESTLLAQPQVRAYMKIVGKDNFTALSYKPADKNERGIFNPDDFKTLEQQMEAGKTPWIAAHKFGRGSNLEQAKIGPLYLAQKTNSYVIPTAMEIRGGKNVKLDESMVAPIKQVLNRLDIVYHVGAPVRFEPVDVRPLDLLFEKRKSGQKITEEDFAAARAAHNKLKQQAEQLSLLIASMLPEEQRGKYAESPA